MVYTALFRRVSSWLLPPRCVACDAPGDAQLMHLRSGIVDLCRDCLAALPLNTHACLHCAVPLAGKLAGDAVDLRCGQCLRRPPLFHRACCALRYEYPANHLIQQFKYGQGLAQGRMLAAVLGRQVLEHYSRHDLNWPECIVPVPLHIRRYRQRGYNQVIEVGQQLSQRLDLPLRTDVVERVRDTPEQAGLTRRERRRNLRGAFQITAKTLPTHVVVLDDVITTASTVGEIAKQLRRAGVRQIDVWGIARAAWRTPPS